MYELTHELPNDFDLGSLEYQEIRKDQEYLWILENYSPVPSLPSKMKILSILAQDSLKMKLELFP